MDWFYWERESGSPPFGLKSLLIVSLLLLFPSVLVLDCELSNGPQTSARPSLQASAGPAGVGGVTDDPSMCDLTRTGLPGGDGWENKVRWKRNTGRWEDDEL